MSRIKTNAALIVIGHLIISLVHGAAHQRLGVGLEPWQLAYVLIVITLAPLVALALYWTRWRLAGALLLATSMFGSLAFGFCYHFVVISPDHVSHLPEGDGQTLFVVTAVLLAISESAGTLFGLWSWNRFRAARAIAPPLR